MDSLLNEHSGEFLLFDIMSGKLLKEKGYEAIEDFHEGLAKVKKDGKWGYINKEGREVIPCKYDSASDFREGLVFVDKDNHTLIIDQSGQEIVQFNCVLTWIIPGEGIVALKMN